MRIENAIGNLVYDDAEPECYFIVSESQGQKYAFVQVLDVGNPGNRLSKPIKKRYWGRFSDHHPEQSISQIMNAGGKWPMLPGVRYT